MAQLVVRKLEPEIVLELRKRAGRSGRSMEAEHREILRVALRPRRGSKSLKENHETASKGNKVLRACKPVRSP
jgi:plasmid stability protein